MHDACYYLFSVKYYFIYRMKCWVFCFCFMGVFLFVCFVIFCCCFFFFCLFCILGVFCVVFFLILAVLKVSFFALACWCVSVIRIFYVLKKLPLTQSPSVSHPSKLLDWTFWHNTGRNLCLADDTTAPGFCGLGLGWTEWSPSQWRLYWTVPDEKFSLEWCPVQCQEQIYLWNYLSIGLILIKNIDLTQLIVLWSLLHNKH